MAPPRGALVRQLDAWRAPEGTQLPLAAAVIAALLVATVGAAYLAGGAKQALTHLTYLPILLAAFCFGVPGGVGVALVAAVLLGPWMPFDVAAGVPQLPVNIVLRGACFLLVGLVAGLLCSALAGQLSSARRQWLEDRVTRLGNKPALQQQLTDALSVEAARDRRVALVQIRIENFDAIIAALDHRLGDSLLRKTADWLRDMVPAGTLLYRLEGAQFALLFPEAGYGKVLTCVREIAKGLRQPIWLDTVPVLIQPRIGIAQFPDHAGDPWSLLRCASFAVFAAARTSQDYQIYDPLEDKEHNAALSLLTDLQAAIEGEQLMLHYQPKVDLRSGRCVGAEALVRWRHPQHGMIPPGRFIPLVEQTGLIVSLTEWVLRQALAQISQWTAAGRDLTVAVNVSARNLEDLSFPETVDGLLRFYSVDPRRLELEITEGAIVANHDRALDALHRLRRIGVRIALDDFGTGYSSLQYLKDLPLDVLKIDQAFVRRPEIGERDEGIIRWIVDLGHQLNLEVVAEGIETWEAYSRIAGLGCEIGQGYFIAKPAPREDFEEWLRYGARSSPAGKLVRLVAGGGQAAE